MPVRLTPSQARKCGVSVPRGTKRSKYGSVAVIVDGIRFHSKREARRYGELRALERAGEISKLKRQQRFPVWVAPDWADGEKVHVCDYVCDFTYYDKSGLYCVEDCKGYPTKEYRLKKKLVEALYGITIHET